RSAPFGFQKMKQSALRSKHGGPLSCGAGPLVKSAAVAPALNKLPCAQPPISTMPISPLTKAGRFTAHGCAAMFGFITLANLRSCSNAEDFLALQGIGI